MTKHNQDNSKTTLASDAKHSVPSKAIIAGIKNSSGYKAPLHDYSRVFSKHFAR